MPEQETPAKVMREFLKWYNHENHLRWEPIDLSDHILLMIL